MSFLNLFNKKEKEPVVVDKIWMNQAAKEIGCIEYVNAHPKVTLVAWSELTADRFQEILNKKSLSVELILAGSSMPNRMRGREICFLEHHLFYKKEIDLLNSWKCEEAVFLNSIADPVFWTLNPERLISLMEKMGMEENELIEHSMITKSIKRAQQKLEKERTLPEMPPNVKEWWKHVR